MPQLEPLNLRINGDSRGLSQALGRSRGEVRGFTDNVGAIAAKLRTGIVAGFAAVAGAAASTAVAVAKIREIQSKIDEAAKAADKLGLTFNELGGLRLAIGESTGLDTGTIDSAIERLLVNLAAAEQGTGRAFEALQRLGLNAGELLQAGPVEALQRIADRTREVGNETDQLKLAYDLFGRSGTAIVSTLRGGAEAIREATAFQERWNSLTEAQVLSVEAANDAWGRVSVMLGGITQTVAAELAPLFQVVAEEFLGIQGSAKSLTASVRELVDQLALAVGFAYDLAEAFVQVQIAYFKIQRFQFQSSVSNLSKAFSFDNAGKFLERLRELRAEFDEKAEEAANRPQERTFPNALLEQLEESKDATDELAKAQERYLSIAERFRSELATPSEAFAQRIEELRQAVLQGGLEVEVFGRGVAKAAEELLRASGAAERLERVRATLAGSAEAVRRAFEFATGARQADQPEGRVGNAVRAAVRAIELELKDSGAAKATEQADHNRKVEAAVANAKLDTQSDLLRRILQALDRGKPSAVLDL